RPDHVDLHQQPRAPGPGRPGRPRRGRPGPRRGPPRGPRRRGGLPGAGAAMSRALLPTADRRKTARLTWRLVRRQRLPLTLAVASFVLAGLSALVPPWMLGRITDLVLDGGSTADVTAAAAVIAVAALVGGLATWASVAFLARAGEPALAALREDVLERALALDSARIEAAGT